MKSVFVETYGCAANFSEGEIMKGILNSNSCNFKVINDKKCADVIVLNICTVKGNDAAFRQIRNTTNEFPKAKLVIAGCVPNDCIAQIQQIAKDAAIINTHNVHKIADAVSQVLNNCAVQIVQRTKKEKILLPKIRKNPLIGIISISQGCDSACTFCSVKFIKGAHVSYSKEKLIEEVKSCVKDGCKEIWLTGQDTSCYGLDIGTNLPKLLQMLVQVEGDFKIRVGMANPKHVKNYAKELIDVFKSDKIFKFLHIPVQSGSNEVLKAMKRDYCVDDFKKIIEQFRKEIPQITLSTDIICGFPNETIEQFNETVELLKELKLDCVNISRFESRPGTLAAKMQGQICGKDKKVRSAQITSAFVWAAYAKNKDWIGWQGEIVINEAGKHDCFIGRNFAYKPVALKGTFLLGQKLNVKITDCTSTHLMAQIVC